MAVDDLNAALGYDDKGETFCGIAVIPGQDDISLPGKVRSIDFTIAEETWSVTPTAEGLRVMHLGHRTRLAVLPHITNMIEILSVEN